MDVEFWRGKWQRNEIGFHEPVPHRFLTAFWPRLGIARGGAVLVPLCGKSLDLLWLRDAGYRVIGIELSELAVEAFFTEHGLPVQREAGTHFCRYRHGEIEILCGDFFQVRPEDVGAVAGLYDRAAMIALPAQLRRRYTAHLCALAPRATGLLVTLDYRPSLETAPPFSVDPDEVEALLGADFSLEMLARDDVLADNAKLAARGLNALHETAFALRPR